MNRRAQVYVPAAWMAMPARSARAILPGAPPARIFERFPAARRGYREDSRFTDPARRVIYAFQDFIPVVHESAFVHPQAAVTGNVIIGRDVYVGPGAAIRGDWGGIVIEDGCNVQEGCVIHMFPGVTVVLEESAHIGHGAVVHGARIGRNSLVGMNAVIMDNAVIGAECIVGALCFVPSEMKVPARKVVVGNPAKIVKDVSEEMLAWKTEGTRLYQALPARLHESLRECEPLREIPEGRSAGGPGAAYRTWKETRRG